MYNVVPHLLPQLTRLFTLTNVNRGPQAVTLWVADVALKRNTLGRMEEQYDALLLRPNEFLEQFNEMSEALATGLAQLEALTRSYSDVKTLFTHPVFRYYKLNSFSPR